MPPVCSAPAGGGSRLVPGRPLAAAGRGGGPCTHTPHPSARLHWNHVQGGREDEVSSHAFPHVKGGLEEGCHRLQTSLFPAIQATVTHTSGHAHVHRASPGHSSLVGGTGEVQRCLPALWLHQREVGGPQAQTPPGSAALTHASGLVNELRRPVHTQRLQSTVRATLLERVQRISRKGLPPQREEGQGHFGR